MTDDVLAGAIAQLAQDMSDAWARLAETLSGTTRGLAATTSDLPALTARTPVRERLFRQALIIHEVLAAGGSVSQTTWHEIAKRYGYSGRGTAGFFNRGGLMEMRDGRDGTKVFVTKAGKDRLKAHRDQVDAYLTQREEPVPA